MRTTARTAQPAQPFVVTIATCTCGCEDCFEDGVCYCDCLPEGHPERAN